MDMTHLSGQDHWRACPALYYYSVSCGKDAESMPTKINRPFMCQRDAKTGCTGWKDAVSLEDKLTHCTHLYPFTHHVNSQRDAYEEVCHSPKLLRFH